MIDIAGIIDTVTTFATDSGLFAGGVVDYEARTTPTEGIMCAVWFQTLAPIPERSGLASTTALLTLNVRLYLSTLHQPYGDMETLMVQAADTLMGDFSGDFDFGGKVSNVDLLGAHGPGLSGQAGYVPNMDGKLMRVVTITLPLVINDVWEQAEA